STISRAVTASTSFWTSSRRSRGRRPLQRSKPPTSCSPRMRILLDEQLPRRLARHIRGHHVRTVQQQSWSGLRNGELLRRAAASGFEVFVTADRNLSFQQNLAEVELGVVVLVARSNRLDDLLPLVPAILTALQDIRPGEIRRVGSS